MHRIWMAGMGLLIAIGARAQEPARLTLVVLNQARVPAKPLEQMLKELGEIMSLAGISAEPVICPVSPDQLRPTI